MDSYITESGALVVHYDPVLDNYEEAERKALIKHGIDGARITTIAVTPRTDFINNKLCHKASGKAKVYEG